MNLDDFIPAFGPKSYVELRSPLMNGSRLRWLWRMHRQRFIESGAAVMIGGQVHVLPERADAVILEIGREAAMRKVDTP